MNGQCPCCKRDGVWPGCALCDDCVASGCEQVTRDYGTRDLPYPYCAATDSSPLASE